MSDSIHSVSTTAPARPDDDELASQEHGSENAGDQVTTGGVPPEAEQNREQHRRVNRKTDFALLPLLSLIYVFNGLDRGNVGNAQTQGFTHDIGAEPDDLNLAVSLFFVTFVTFQPVSAAMGRMLGQKHWIPFLMFSWGSVSIGQAFISGKASLIATRLLIGAFESGFYPTAVAYLSAFYCRYDLATRLGLFYSQYAIAGAFSGSIAYGVFQIKHGLLKNWQYLFIIEGSLTCLAAIIAWAALPSGPSTAWFLTAEERAFAVERIRVENRAYIGNTKGTEKKLTQRDVVETINDWKLWYVLVFNICASVPATAFSVFLPLVVQGMGFSSIEANLMSVPPYVCGGVGLCLFAFSSDRHKERGFHILGGIMIAIIGLVVVVTASSNGAKYVGLCVFVFGSYISPPLTMAWLSGNTPEPGKRSLVLGVNGWGNLAGVIGAQLYRPEWAPQYMIPFYTTLGFMIVAFLGYLAYRFSLRHANTNKLAILARMSQEEVQRERADMTRYADKKRTFLYGL